MQSSTVDFSKFPLSNDQAGSRLYDPKQKQFQISIKSPSLTARTVIEKSLRDFQLSVEVEKLDGSDIPWFGLSLIVNYNTENEESYYFLISGKGTFSIEYNQFNRVEDKRGKQIIIKKATKSLSIKKDLNVLELTRAGSEVKFFVNEQILAKLKTKIEESQEVYLGLVAYTPSTEEKITVGYSNLEITQY